MYKLSGIISVVLLAIMVVFILIRFKKIRKQYLSLGVYLIGVFIYEFAMLVTSTYKINNHILANLHSLFYLPLISWVLAEVYKRIYGVNISLARFVLVISAIVLAGWLTENFYLGSVFVFNSIVPVTSAVLVSLVGIYLLNILLFVSKNSLVKQADVLMLSGIMVRSVLFGFMLWLFNFNNGYEKEFYTMLLALINMGLCISDIFFLFALFRIVGTNSTVKRKTTPVV